MSPEEGGWKNQADFEEWDRTLKEKEKSLMDKIRDIDKNMLQLSVKEGDLLLDISYVGDSKARYDALELFRSTREAHRENLSFDMDKYKDEFVKMSQRMDKEALIVQDKMAKYAAKNSYNLKNTGWYNWGKVEMDMSSNQHEKALKNGLIGSWQTKYHEEGHQIDHLLGKVAKFCDNPVKGFYACMTNSECSVGNAMGKAIEKDLLTFVNDAVSYVNKQGKTCKSLKSFARIPYEVKEATIDYLNYLTSNRADEVTKCRLGILTDALGCYTEGKLHPYGFGFWGHKFKYCKSVKKNGAISETWATFCALRVCGSPEEIEEVKKIMPNTWENMSKVYSEIAEYLLTHDI